MARGISLPSGAAMIDAGVVDQVVRLDEKIEAPLYAVGGDMPFFDGGNLYAPGDQVVHLVEPGPNLIPLNNAAKDKHKPVMDALNDGKFQSNTVGMLAYGGPQSPANEVADLKARLAVLEGKTA